MCNICGHCYQNPQLTEAELSELYKHQYRDIKLGYNPKSISSEYLALHKENNALRFKELLPFLLNKRGGVRERKVLDIGCAAGITLKMFKDEGWIVHGVEPTERMAEYAWQMGIPVICGFFNSKMFTKESFDLILCIQVLEHIKMPKDFLLQAKKILKDDGLIYLEVPNLLKPKVFLSDVFGVPHISAFSLCSLERFLTTASLRIIWHKESNLGLQVLAKNESLDFNTQIHKYTNTHTVEELKKILDDCEKTRRVSLNWKGRLIEDLMFIIASVFGYRFLMRFSALLTRYKWISGTYEL